MDSKPIFRAPLILALAQLTAFPVGGCAVVDRYGARAIEYNEQTAASKSTMVLLNILRAAYREPLQFTDVTTVTGTASAQGSLSAEIPVKLEGPSFTMPSILNLKPSATVSGRPNFSVASLSTQEFYRGIQTELPAQIVEGYAEAGVSPNLLPPLLISDITLEDPDRIRVLRNSGSSEASVKGFRHVTKQLVEHGLGWNIRDVDPEWIGPKLTNSEASDPKPLSGVAQAMTTSESLLTFKSTNKNETYFRLGRSVIKKKQACASGTKIFR